MLLFTEIVFIMDLIYTRPAQKSTALLIFFRKNHSCPIFLRANCPVLRFQGFQFLQTSIQDVKPEYCSNSGIESPIPLLPLPQAGNTVVKRFRETSR